MSDYDSCLASEVLRPPAWLESVPYATEHEPGARWFALSVKPRHERTSAAALRFKGYQEFVPLYQSRRRWSDRVKEIELPLFAGYVFCRFDARFRLPILTTPGVLKIVGAGRDPIPVQDSEMEALEAVARSGILAEPWPFLQAGCRVRVEEGPLRGTEGFLLEVKSRERLVLSVTLLSRSIAVEVDRDWVRPIQEQPWAGRSGRSRGAAGVR
jgi:transcription antitermination factor NusG